jgi:hypothetical protein
MLNEMTEENILKLVDKKIAITDTHKLTLVSAEGN